MRTMKLLRVALVTSAVMFVTSCSIVPQDYEKETPVLDMKEYFNGDLEAWGLFQDYTGKVIKRFHVAMNGTWDKSEGVLDEYFTYSDGTKQRRTWRITRIDEHNYVGTAGDVVGEARGTAYGNALYWEYVMALDVDGEIYNVKFEDWMYMIDQQTMINRSVMSKFGFNLGEVILVFRKTGAMNTSNTMPVMNTDSRSWFPYI